ncbi:MAG: glycosyltransferase [bacterium]
MKKTLIIANHYPLPENNGSNIRTMHFVRYFQKLGPVDIVYSHTLPGAETGNGAFANEYLFELQDDSKDLISRMKRFVATKNRPLPISKYTAASETELFKIITANDYDYLLVRYIRNTFSLFRLSAKYQKRVLVDFDDLLSDALYDAQIKQVRHPLRKLRLQINRKYLREYEKRCLHFGAALFCNESDLLKVSGDQMKNGAVVVPNVYSRASFARYNFGDGFSNPNILLFVGLLCYKPNVDGLNWFVDSIFPAFRQKYSDGKLWIVGRTPNEEVKEMCAYRKDIELFADVPDVKPFYRKCRAVVVPVLTGGGTRIKILEAALANRPILSTPMGANGLALNPDSEIKLFSEENEFVKCYQQLSNTTTYRNLINNARKVVTEKYSQDNFETVLDDLQTKLEVQNESVKSDE